MECIILICKNGYNNETPKADTVIGYYDSLKDAICARLKHFGKSCRDYRKIHGKSPKGVELLVAPANCSAWNEYYDFVTVPDNSKHYILAETESGYIF
jgi:hypothetical protein